MAPRTAAVGPILEFVSKLCLTRGEDPLIIGLTGPQGCGKSTTVSQLAESLRKQPLNLKVVTLSLDDFYLTHSEQAQVAKEHPGNPLLAHRGQPGTHDVQLCLNVLKALKSQQPADIPVYDKSAFNGEGDRKPQGHFVFAPYDVVLFEGWCTGFLPVEKADLRSIIAKLPNTAHSKAIPVEYLEDVNAYLKDYVPIWNYFDAFVQLDAEDIKYVYEWRGQQEKELIKEKGTGMSQEQLAKFIDGYMPSYEIYLDALRRKGVENKPRLRLVYDLQRNIVKSE